MNTLQRLTWVIDTLEKYARWAVANTSEIRDGARVGETQEPLTNWRQMYGLDKFCEQNLHLLDVLKHQNFKTSPRDYMRTLMSRAAGQRPDRLRNGIFGKTFPSIINKQKATSYLAGRHAKKSAVEQQLSFAAVKSVDPISESLDTSFPQQNDGLENVIAQLKNAGVQSITMTLK